MMKHLMKIIIEFQKDFPSKLKASFNSYLAKNYQDTLNQINVSIKNDALVLTYNRYDLNNLIQLWKRFPAIEYALLSFAQTQTQPIYFIKIVTPEKTQLLSQFTSIIEQKKSINKAKITRVCKEHYFIPNDLCDDLRFKATLSKEDQLSQHDLDTYLKILNREVLKKKIRLCTSVKGKEQYLKSVEKLIKTELLTKSGDISEKVLDQLMLKGVSVLNEARFKTRSPYIKFLIAFCANKTPYPISFAALKEKMGILIEDKHFNYKLKKAVTDFNQLTGMNFTVNCADKKALFTAANNSAKAIEIGKSTQVTSTILTHNKGLVVPNYPQSNPISRTNEPSVLKPANFNPVINQGSKVNPQATIEAIRGILNKGYSKQSQDF